MEHFISTVKLGMLQYCHSIKNTASQESVIGCIVGEDLQWSENQAVVSFVAEVCKSVGENTKLTQRCAVLDKNFEEYRELNATLNRKMRASQQDSILHAYKLETELSDLKESNLVLSTVCEKDKAELDRVKSKLIEVEMYMDSDEGGFTLQLEEELALAKLRLAELESEKDEWEMNRAIGR